MSEPVSKTKQMLALYTAGDIKGALRLASTFKIGVPREEQKLLKRGYECIVHPQTYKQMGVVPEESIEVAKGVLEWHWVK